MTERTSIFSSEEVCLPVLSKRLCFPEHHCWEVYLSVEEFLLGWNAGQAIGVSSISQISLAVKVFPTKCCLVLRATLGMIDLERKKRKIWYFCKVQIFLHCTPGDPLRSSCLQSSMAAAIHTWVRSGLFLASNVVPVPLTAAALHFSGHPQTSRMEVCPHQCLCMPQLWIGSWKETQKYSVKLLGEGMKIASIFRTKECQEHLPKQWVPDEDGATPLILSFYLLTVKCTLVSLCFFLHPWGKKQATKQSLLNARWEVFFLKKRVAFFAFFQVGNFRRCGFVLLGGN